MKKIIILLAFLPSLVIGQKQVNSKISKATVFSKGAQLERTVSLSLNKGENEVSLVNLEQSLNQKTIQFYGTEDVVVVSNEFISEETNDDFIAKNILDIKKQLKQLDRELAFMSVKSNNYSNEKNLILANKDVRGDEGLAIEDLTDLANFYRDRLNRIDSLSFELGLKKSEVQKERNKLQKELNASGYRRNMGVIKVKLIASKATKINLRMTYVINNAGWTPFYDMKSNSLDGPVKVIAKASIYQNTGVNWKNVALVLSTSTPNNYGVIPEVHPWTLYFQQEYKNRGYKKSSSYGWSSRAAVSNMKTAYASEEISTADFTTTTENMTNREYVISLPYSIKGQNGKAVVELDKYSMEADYVYYTAPKYDKNVYLLANIKDWEQHNLLPGTANMFLNGTYMGNSFIDPSKVTDTLSLLMGKDQDVVADRKKVKDYNKKSFLGGKKTTELGLELVIKNKKNKEIHIIVEDQVPISSTEDIEVKLLDKSRAKHEEKTGKLTWDYNLESGKVKKHLIRYQVKHAKDKVIKNL